MRAKIAALICLFLFPQVVHARVDSDSISPVQILSGEEFKKIPINERKVSDLLNAVPNSSDKIFATRDLDLAKTNLQKNLVLINGRRTDQDHSTIPAEMIDRIEVLKDNASAIYGSDALSGVVNFITKKNFELHPQELFL